MDHLGGKWPILIVTGLEARTLRFSELKRKIPDVSQRMLTKTLRELERDGLVDRKVTPSVPPRVDYSLTKRGRSLVETLRPIAEWALDHRLDIARSRALFDEEAANRSA